MNKALEHQHFFSTSEDIEEVIINGQKIELDIPKLKNESKMSHLIKLDNGEYIYIELNKEKEFSIRSSVSFKHKLTLDINTEN